MYCRKRGRPALWAPDLISEEIKREIEELQDRVGREDGEKVRVWRDYESFCSINDINPLSDEAMISFGASLRWCSRAAPSTILTKYNMCLRMFRQRKAAPYCVLSPARLAKILAFDAAATTAEHASDSDIAPLVEGLLTARPCRMRTLTMILLLSGLRPVDLFYLEPSHIRMSDNMLVIDVHRAKNRRSPSDKTTLTICSAMAGVWIPDIAPVLRRALNSISSTCLCSKEEYISVNAYLKGVFRFKCTSYTLRRCFIHRAIKWQTSEGVTNWENVIAITLHKNARVLQSSYMPKAEDQAI